MSAVARLDPHVLSELEVVRQALAWAKKRRIPVKIAAEGDAPGIHCVSSHARERWARRGPDAAVTPIEAAVLMVQPEADELPEALAAALGEHRSVAFSDGVHDGMGGGAPRQGWLLSSSSALYTQGYMLGLQVRTEVLSWVCSFHERRVKLGERCPQCMAGLGIPGGEA